MDKEAERTSLKTHEDLIIYQGAKLVQNGYNEEQKRFIADDINLSSRHLIWHCTKGHIIPFFRL